MTTAAKPWIVGITGASGAVYGVRLCRYLLDSGRDVRLIISDAGWRVLKEEHAWDTTDRASVLEDHFGGTKGRYTYHPNKDIGAAVASGSFRTEGMVILPCSMGTASAIAHGTSDNLLERAADVMLKEGRRLIVAPRETPLHAAHLENLLALAKLGATIIPAMPAFYHHPRTIEDMIDFLVGKVLDVMQIDHELYRRWGE